MESNQVKITHFHYEEVVCMLMILATDLAEYDAENLDIFAEVIEGRADVLLEQDYLLRLPPKYGIKSTVLADFEQLRHGIVALYASHWSRKLAIPSEMEPLKKLAWKLLEALGIDYVEPLQYMETHLELDLTFD
jgi:hypothetical protein